MNDAEQHRLLDAVAEAGRFGTLSKIKDLGDLEAVGDARILSELQRLEQLGYVEHALSGDVDQDRLPALWFWRLTTTTVERLGVFWCFTSKDGRQPDRVAHSVEEVREWLRHRIDPWAHDPRSALRIRVELRGLRLVGIDLTRPLSEQ